MGSFGKGSRKSRPKSKSTSFKLHGVSISADLQKTFWMTLLGICLVVRGGVFLLNPQLATLECDRLRPNFGMCKLAVSGLLGTKVTPFPLDELKRAEVQNQGKSRQLVLLMPDGKLYFPINNGFSFTEEKASQINVFVQDSETKSLKVKQDNRWIVYPLASILTGFGGWLVWFNLSNLLNRFARRSNS